jgi:hypothetical protein
VPSAGAPDSPQAHGDLEAEQRAIRTLAIKVLCGENALKMDVASFPIDGEAVKLQSAVSKAMSEALNGKGTLNVTVKREKPAAWRFDSARPPALYFALRFSLDLPLGLRPAADSRGSERK